MDTELLVEPRIEDGHRLLVELVRAGLDVSAAGWLKASDGGMWSLYIGTAAVDPDRSGKAYRTLYDCLQRLPAPAVELSEVRLTPVSDPVIRDLAGMRDRYAGGRLPTRYRGPRIGDRAIDEAYIYPRITGGLTRDEVVQTVTGLLQGGAGDRPSTVTLRDGTVLRGIPYGLERSRPTVQPAVLEIKLFDDADGSTHTVPADEVVNIQ